MSQALDALVAELPDERIHAIRQDFINALLMGLTIILLVLMVIICVSAFQTGWLRVYTIQLVCDGAFFLGVLYRHRLSYNAKVYLLFAMLLIGSLSGLPTLGLAAGC